MECCVLLTRDFAVPLVCHVFSADAPVLPQHSGVGTHIATLQEGDVSLTHCDVFWSGISVQLLMPGLQEMALNALCMTTL